MPRPYSSSTVGDDDRSSSQPSKRDIQQTALLDAYFRAALDKLDTADHKGRVILATAAGKANNKALLDALAAEFLAPKHKDCHWKATELSNIAETYSAEGLAVQTRELAKLIQKHAVKLIVEWKRHELANVIAFLAGGGVGGAVSDAQILAHVKHYQRFRDTGGFGEKYDARMREALTRRGLL